MEVVSRKEAKAQGLKFYFTGRSCKNGHVSERYTSCGACMDCSTSWAEAHKEERVEYMKAYQEKDSYKAYQKQYRSENKEVLTKSKLEWRERNREKVREYFREYNEKNLLRLQEYRKNYNSLEEVRQRYKDRYRENPEIFTIHKSIREALKRTTQCKWANKGLLREICKQVKRQNQSLKISHHADHIIPLQHPLVCGLHNEFNLRIITAAENLKKSNKFDPETYRHEDYVSFWDELNLT